ncbi:Vesicle-associated membrane protein-associated protein, partial [Smittium mucronatum]
MFHCINQFVCLLFLEPSTVISETQLILSNPNESPVAFKIKTTAPKHYFVRPNSGSIAPQASITITIGLQPQQDIGPDFKCKDKFLVQSTALQSDFIDSDIHNIWSKVDSLDKSLFHEKKLKVKYIFDSASAQTDPQVDSSASASASTAADSSATATAAMAPAESSERSPASPV